MSDPQNTSSTLLARVRDAQDFEAWDQFLDIYTPMVRGFCSKRGLQAADAEDVSQEVMKSVAQSIRKFEYDRARGTFRSWLFTVTRSKLNNFFSARRRHPQGSGSTDMHRFLEEQPSLEEEREWDRDYKRRLFEWAAEDIRDEFQDTTWQAFWRTSVENSPTVTVAESLGMTAGAVYIAKSRVTARLRERILEVAEENF